MHCLYRILNPRVFPNGYLQFQIKLQRSAALSLRSGLQGVDVDQPKKLLVLRVKIQAGLKHRRSPLGSLLGERARSSYVYLSSSLNLSCCPNLTLNPSLRIW